jgi:acylphosphatase
VGERNQAKRYFVSGTVQGVGFRFFVERAAGRLGLNGYVKNLRDGRVEVYAVGSVAMLSNLRTELERGPRAAIVTGVAEEDVPLDPRYSLGFSIEHDSW